MGRTVSKKYLFLCIVQGSHLIVAYDEHEVNNTFKFGVVYQKFGQVSNHDDLVSLTRTHYLILDTVYI